jgi:hypothetical protein
MTWFLFQEKLVLWFNLSILHIPNPFGHHGYGTLETLLPWFPVLVFFPIVVHPLSLLAMPFLLTCGELDTMLLWYSHWNAEYSGVAFCSSRSPPGYLYRWYYSTRYVIQYCNSRQTYSSTALLVVLEYYLYITSTLSIQQTLRAPYMYDVCSMHKCVRSTPLQGTS